MTTHQQKQIEVIDQIEGQIQKNSLNFSTVSPVEDFENDPRICLTSIHLPSKSLLTKIEAQIIKPLKQISPEHYYYPTSSLHMTIKNIRVINFPINFSSKDIQKAKQVFDQVIPNHKKFKVYFYRLLLFPNNLALIGTTDEQLDKIILDLDQRLKETGIPDDKQYINSKYFFSNMTLARFSKPLTKEFTKKVQQISEEINFAPYTVNSVSLITTNAVLKNLQTVKTWILK